MIPVIIITVAAGAVGFLGGCLIGGIRTVEKLGAAEDMRDEYKRRLDRILETERPDVTAHPKLEMIYHFARGQRV